MTLPHIINLANALITCVSIGMIIRAHLLTRRARAVLVRSTRCRAVTIDGYGWPKVCSMVGNHAVHRAGTANGMAGPPSPSDWEWTGDRDPGRPVGPVDRARLSRLDKP